MTSWEKFNETDFPPIDQCDYRHAQRVWLLFNIKDLGDHHDLYV